jgi:hypothetical protein
MRRWLRRCVCAMVLTAGIAAAQTTSTTGAYDQLSPGNQKIAQALFDAQQAQAPSGTAPALTLDDIAVLNQSSQGWGEVFKYMQTQGLVQEKNLGQVVQTYQHQPRTTAPSSEVVITTGSGKTVVSGNAGKSKGSVSAGKGTKGDHGQGSSAGASTAGQSNHGVGRGGKGSGAGVGKSSHGGGRVK